MRKWIWKICFTLWNPKVNLYDLYVFLFRKFHTYLIKSYLWLFFCYTMIYYCFFNLLSILYISIRYCTVAVRYFIDFRPTGENEMCNFYMMYWVENTEPLEQQYCFSSGPPFYYWRENFDNIPERELITYRRNDIKEEWLHLKFIYIILYT